jgi:uncharacterized protein (TIGR02266 family)
MPSADSPAGTHRSVIEEGLGQRIDALRRRDETWRSQRAEARLELEGLLETRVGRDAAGLLEEPIFARSWFFDVPKLELGESVADEKLWAACGETLEALQARELELGRLEAELNEANARAEALRCKAYSGLEAERSSIASADSRRFPRFALSAAVELATEGLGARGRCLNISEGGLFAACGRLVTPGTRVELALALPDVGWLEARGVVRWGRRFNPRFPAQVPGVGIELVELDRPSRRALESFLEQRRANDSRL